MTITERLIKDSSIKYDLQGVKQYGMVMTDFIFKNTLQVGNFLDWLQLNIEYYEDNVKYYYKNDGLTVTIEFK